MRLALLTNFVAPYRIPLFRALARAVGELRVFVSTPMEPNRAWSPAWADLDVVAQRTVTLTRRWRHAAGFVEPSYVHFPYDTLPRLARYRPDAVITGELGARTIQSLLYGRGRRCPVLIWATLSERLEQGRGRGRELLRSVLLRGAAGVLVNGESGARYIRGFGFPDRRIYRVPQPVDVDRFDAPPTRDGDAAHRLLYVGRLSAGKGLPLLFDALERRGHARPDRPIELRVVGDGPLRGELEARRLPGNVRVSFLGAVPYDALPGVYAAAGLLVFPTLADEWGLVVNEAMASGVPVIGSVHAQAVEELVEPGVGWRFDPESPESADRALATALDASPDELDAMRRAARDRARRLRPEDAAARIVAALDDVAGDGSGGG